MKALVRRIVRAHKRTDIVVDSVAGEDPLMKQYGYPLAGGPEDRGRDPMVGDAARTRRFKVKIPT